MHGYLERPHGVLVRTPLVGRFDWRDIFRQPRPSRDSRIVASEAIDERARCRRDKRTRTRARAASHLLGGTRHAPRTCDGERIAIANATEGPPPPPRLRQRRGIVRQAEIDRGEILRIGPSLSRPERARIPEVVASANALVRARTLARPGMLHSRRRPHRRKCRGHRPGTRAAGVGSQSARSRRGERRVRRLASSSDSGGRGGCGPAARAGRARLDGCAWRSELSLDVLRLRAGTQSHEHVTSIAEQALVLAREVDSAMYVADEMGRLASRDQRPRPDHA